MPPPDRPWWDDLSDADLRAELLERGVMEIVVRHVVAGRRSRLGARERISRELGWDRPKADR